LLVLFLLVVVVLVGAGFWFRTSFNRPVEHDSSDKIITIEPGASTQSIVKQLENAGIVRHPLPVNIYLRLTERSGRLKAGDYKFDSPISPRQALEKIEKGEVSLESLTVPEGLTRFEIAERFAKTGKATAEEFLRLTYATELISDIAPQATNLEGYLFPDTYYYSANTTAEDLVKAMVNRFESVFTPAWRSRAAELSLTTHQAITLASIIEEEAKIAEERPVISSVFRNRLRIGMPLASDPTFIYAAILARDYDGNPNQPRHRRRESPYNTYIRTGLPPGPIASPGRASIEAALYPEATDFLYFVVNGTEGRHKFSRTSEEHEAAAAEYHRQQRELGN
jgi:UPF0755 protein